jgi:hypothetical protein
MQFNLIFHSKAHQSIPKLKPIVPDKKTAIHMSEESEAIAPCKEMLVIPVNKLGDEKRKLGKSRAEEEERHSGLLTQNINEK